jgi:hypothetical protein
MARSPMMENLGFDISFPPKSCTLSCHQPAIEYKR